MSPRAAHLLLLTLGLVALRAGAADGTRFPAPSELPALSTLPDPLRLLDGTPVTSRRLWEKQARPELKALFQHYMYGHFPPPPRQVVAAVLTTHPRALDGRATLEEVRLTFGTGLPGFNLLIITPNDRPGPWPVILGVNFCGNHSVLADPAIALPAGWMPKNCPDCPDNRALEPGRGKDAASWDIPQVIARGYALATFYHGDLDPDRPDAPEGIRAAAARARGSALWKKPRRDEACPACPDRAAQGDYDWSTIAAWAWGFHRATDHLLTDRRFDPRRLAVYGHSRNGKTALLAGAFDERVSLILCHQAGCGGSAPSRGTIGESVKQINDRFPHWFNALFKQFNDQPARLPFDQHELIALCAPRPVLLSNATDDQWANPAGQFEMLLAATPVYQLLGVPGLAATQMPAPGTLIPSPLGYFLRTGRHAATPQDWKAFLDFAEARWGAPPAAPAAPVRPQTSAKP